MVNNMRFILSFSFFILSIALFISITNLNIVYANDKETEKIHNLILKLFQNYNLDKSIIDSPIINNQKKYEFDFFVNKLIARNILSSQYKILISDVKQNYNNEFDKKLKKYLQNFENKISEESALNGAYTFLKSTRSNL